MEEVLAHPLVPRPPTLPATQMGHAILHGHPLAQLRPPHSRSRALAQALLEGLVLRNAHRAAASPGRCRALCPQRAAVTLRGWELHHTPETKGFRMPAW